MSLTPGTRVGAYEIVATIGAGGMGDVYRAIDTVLKRQVALKVLPPEFATDPERMFQGLIDLPPHNFDVTDTAADFSW